MPAKRATKGNQPANKQQKQWDDLTQQLNTHLAAETQKKQKPKKPATAPQESSPQSDSKPPVLPFQAELLQARKTIDARKAAEQAAQEAADNQPSFVIDFFSSLALISGVALTVLASIYSLGALAITGACTLMASGAIGLFANHQGSEAAAGDEQPALAI